MKTNSLIKLAMFLFLSIFIFSDVFAEPVIIESGETIGKDKYKIEATVFYSNYTKKHDSDGNGTDFSNGESRNGYFLPLSLALGVSDTDDLSITVPFYSLSHQLPNSDKLTSESLGDISIIGKSMFTKTPDGGGGSLVLGVKIPTGKSIFDLNEKKIATGSGSWDILLGLCLQEKRGPFILYGNIFYTFRFAYNANKIMGVSDRSMHITPGNILGWNIGAEIPMGTVLSLLFECNSSVNYPGSASYNDTGENITSNIIKNSSPNIVLQDTSTIELSSGLQVNLAKTIFITPAVVVPLRTTNNYSGIKYLISLVLKF